MGCPLFHTCFKVNYARNDHAKMTMHLHLCHFWIESWCKRSCLKCNDVCLWYLFLLTSFFFLFILFLFIPGKVKILAFGLLRLLCSGILDSASLIILFWNLFFFFWEDSIFSLLEHIHHFVWRKLDYISSNFLSFRVIVLLCMYLLSGFINQNLKGQFKYAWCIKYYYANDGQSIEVEIRIFTERGIIIP